MIVDITTSDRNLSKSLAANAMTFRGLEPAGAEEVLDDFPSGALDIHDLSPTGGKNIDKEVLLTCRGYIPAYLVSSRVHAVGVLLSGLRLPTWSGSVCDGAPNLEHWKELATAFVADENSPDPGLQCRTVKGSGLVFLLHGPRRLTTRAANCKTTFF